MDTSSAPVTSTESSSTTAAAQALDVRPDLSVVICTFQRQDLLQNCLESFLTQELGPDHQDKQIEIVVVDNCPDLSARPIVAPLIDPAAGKQITLRYVSEPRTNVAHARNTGVDAALGHLLAFVDDDNIVPPQWVRTVLTLFKDQGIDCVFGDVEPVFPDGTDAASVALVTPYFRRHIEGAANGQIKILPGGHIRGARTCNVVLRKDICFPQSGMPWFDPAFGLAGGEDTDFFMRLGSRLPASHFRTSSDAVMEEFIPADRANTEYVVKRSYWGGQTYALAHSRNAGKGVLGKAHLFAKASIQMALLGARRAQLALTGKPVPLPWRIKFASVRGKFNGDVLLRKTGPYR